MFQHTVSPAAISWQYQVIFGPGKLFAALLSNIHKRMILVFNCQHHCSIYCMPSLRALMLHVFRGMLLCLWLTRPRDVHHTQFFFSCFFPVAVVAFAATVGVVLVLAVAALFKQAGIVVTFQLVIRCRYYPLLFSKAAGLPPSESKLREQIESFQGQLPRISCWICKPTTVSIRFIPQDVFTFIPSLHYSWNPAGSFPVFKTGETRQVLLKLYSAWFCFLCFLLPDSGSPDS